MKYSLISWCWHILIVGSVFLLGNAASALPVKNCIGTFPDGLNSIKNRTVIFEYNAQLLNNPDTQLSAVNISQNLGSNKFSCDTADCTTGDDAIIDVSPGNFQTTNAKNDVNVGYLDTGSIGGSTNNYDNVTVGYLATLNVESNNYSEFFIDSLNVGSAATANLAPGTYWVRDMIVGYGATINVVGGTAHIYVGRNVSWTSSTIINSPAKDASDNPENLLMYFYNSVSFGDSLTFNGTLYGAKDVSFSSASKIYGLVTAENLTLGSDTTISYDERAYDGLSGITWCEGSDATIGSINIIAPGTAINCLPAPVEIEIYDTSGVLISNYAQTINLRTDVKHGDWSKDASANGNLTQKKSDGGGATYEFLDTDMGSVKLYLKNTHSEATNITVESLGVSAQHSITYQAAGFAFKNDGVVANIPAQIAAKDSSQAPNASALSIEALDTASNGTCQALLTGNQDILFALECNDPANCGAAITNISDVQINTNNLASNLKYTQVSLPFATATSQAPFKFNYDEAGSVRLHAYYELLDDSNKKTGEVISATSNYFVVSPYGFCIAASSSESNWQCTSPGLGANCSAYKIAGESFNFDVTAKRWDSTTSVNICHADYPLTQNFSGTVAIAHQLVAPAMGNIGTLASNSVNLNSGQALAQAQSISDMGVYTLSAGGNSYLGSTLPITSSQNIGRFYPKDFYIQSTTAANYNDANNNVALESFSYIGQVETSGDGAIHYAVQPSFNYLLRGINGQTLQNYLAPFATSPVVTSNASSARLGGQGAALDVTAGFNQGLITGPDASFQFTYTLSASDHFVFNRDANSFMAPFNNDVSINISAMTEALDGITLANGPVAINGSGGEIRYGRLNIQNGYGPEIAAVSQGWQMQYYDGNAFILNLLDNLTAYNLADIGVIVVTDVGDSSDPLLNTDSSASTPAGATGNFSGGLLTVDWSAPLNKHFGNYLFPLNVDSWLQYDWFGSGNENPQGNVTFGQYRGHDKIIYWKEINY